MVPLIRAGARGWALLSLLALQAIATAMAQQASEATVKAAFLYKFAGYVEWPPSAFPQADAPFVIGVAGAEEVALELDKLVPGRTINNRRVVVRRVREPEGVRGVHILLIGRTDPAARAFLRAGQQNGVLTVSEAERGLEQGSAINFVLADDRVGFEVSLDSAERAGLRISSRMLSVARRVIPRS